MPPAGAEANQSNPQWTRSVKSKAGAVSSML